MKDEELFQEILKTIESIGKVQYSGFGMSTKNSLQVTHEIIDIFNKEKIRFAKEFANFVGDRPLPEYSASTNKWRWWDNTERDYKYATTEELIEQFSSTNKG